MAKSPTLNPFILSLPLLSALLGCQFSAIKSQTWSESDGVVQETIRCEFARTKGGSVQTFGAQAVLPLGPEPETVELSDESKPGATNINPNAKDADTFLRAASGVRFLRQGDSDPFEVLIAQDSRRKLGIARYDISLHDLKHAPHKAKSLGLPHVEVLPLDTPEAIAEFDDDSRDYASFRKKTKRDFEAMTNLPSGEILVLGSGSDMIKYQKNGQSYRSQAHILTSDGRHLATFDLLPFYLNLQENRFLIGDDNTVGKAELNLEGVALRPAEQGFVIGFYHRGNVNGNGHNALLEFDYSAWNKTLNAAQGLDLESARLLWKNLKPLRIVRIEAPRVASAADPSGQPFPITINDALFGSRNGKDTVLIPAGAEAEYTDAAGVQHDGEVIFAGLMVWQGMNKPNQGTCIIYQAPGDASPGHVSKFGKIEGLAAYNSRGRDLFSQSLYHE
ncbi:MAG: hypothetical protein M3Q07_15135, partial [Pseudobdellovibrionaceae bacterium]|nr:hypothetical protein [Pseudobdellovibrionaceae bacterium]